jgi:predicted O-linked N-acetylglucosamine transferase (SPINDLY family)
MHRRRDWPNALTAYIEALRARPNRALAAYNFGLLQIDQGMGLSSLPFLRRAALLEPESATYQGAMLLAYLRSGSLNDGEHLLADCEVRGVPLDLADWRDRFRQIRAGAQPASLGLPALHPLDPASVVEPPDHPLTLTAASPCQAELANEFARLQELYRAQRLTEMTQALPPLLEQYPNWGEGHHLLGRAWFGLGLWEPAIPALRRASQLLPGRAEIWDHLGNALDAGEYLSEARQAYEFAIALHPVWHVSWNNGADALLSKEQFGPAHQYAFLALALAPDNQSCLFNFARACHGVGYLSRAGQALEALLKVNPRYPGAEVQLGDLCLEAGDHNRAKIHFDHVLASEPDDLALLGRLIFLNNYLGTENQAKIHARARHYAALLSRQGVPATSWSNSPVSDRPLRIGFVSGDLRFHSVGFFFLSVAEALAQSPGLELYAYPTTRVSDSLTEAFRAVFANWAPIPSLTDEQAAARVRADGIDILVDLSGYTGRVRLGLFALKPAPLQVTWLGYFGTTGLTQIDYLLAGPYDVPPREEADFSETIWRLPHTRLCFSRPTEAIEVAPLPALVTGQITFCCFNTLRKVNDRVLGLWAQLLAAIPAARLYLKARQLEEDEDRQAFLSRCLALGIEPARLLLEGTSAFADYLAAYHRVDIALDPFPFTGGTTSIQALWMGVPVLTLAGDRLLARQGESMLRTLELSDWVAESETDYVERAVRLTKDLTALQLLRSGLRQRLEASPLMDAPRFARDLEQAFRDMWCDWCGHMPSNPEILT